MNPDVTMLDLATRCEQIPGLLTGIESTAPASNSFQRPMERVQGLLGDLTTQIGLLTQNGSLPSGEEYVALLYLARAARSAGHAMSLLSDASYQCSVINGLTDEDSQAETLTPNERSDQVGRLRTARYAMLVSSMAASEALDETVSALRAGVDVITVLPRVAAARSRSTERNPGSAIPCTALQAAPRTPGRRR